MRPLRVAALVDLEWSERAGGHVKSWERFAEAAAARDDLDLTVYYLGPSAARAFGPNARLVFVPPAIGTRRFPFLSGMVQHTDLAPCRPALFEDLARCDVLHVTTPFALGGTALRVAARRGRPLVASIHTDFPALSRVYGGALGARWLGAAAARLRFADRVADLSRRRVDRMLRACARVLVSHPAERERLRAVVGEGALRPLRRGVDRARFHPSRRARPLLASRYGVPADAPVVLFAGRVDASKNVLTVASAVARVPGAHLVCVGRGDAVEAVRALLGDRVTLIGPVSQDDLAVVYASADLFAFPSETEVMPNVVLEAKASGLAPVVSARDGGAVLVRDGVDGRVLPAGDDVDAWAATIASLLTSPRRLAMGAAARAWVEASWPSWADVLDADLVPVWREVAGPAVP